MGRAIDGDGGAGVATRTDGPPVPVHRKGAFARSAAQPGTWRTNNIRAAPSHAADSYIMQLSWQAKILHSG
jgi:hypothetical protein